MLPKNLKGGSRETNRPKEFAVLRAVTGMKF